MKDRNDKRDAALPLDNVEEETVRTKGRKARAKNAGTNGAEALDGDEEETAEEMRKKDTADRGNGTLQALKDLTAEEENTVEQHSKITFASILGGDMLGGQWFRKQFWFIVMLTAMIIVYVSNRYYCQQEMLESKALGDTLQDRRYKALTRSSQLKEKTLRSKIEASLQDTTLQTANTPSFNLKVE